PSPSEVACMTSSRPGSIGIASAASTTRVLSGRRPVRAVVVRSKASTVTYDRNSEQSTSTVPSPPSATGILAHGTPTRSTPTATADAAAEGGRTPLRLAGHASARALMLGRLLHLLRSRGLLFDHTRHLPQARERDPLAGKEHEPDSNSDRRLDRLESEP